MRARTLLLAALGLGACAFDSSGLEVDDPGSDPGDPGGQPDPGDPGGGMGPGACAGDVLPVAPSNVDRCDVPAPGGNLALGAGAWTIDTTELTLLAPDGEPVTISSAVVPQDGGPELAVVAVNKLFLSKDAVVRVVGTRPLVLISFSDATIEGTIDASAAANVAGAGAGDLIACAGSNGATGAEQKDGFGNAGGAGGAGAGFGTAGGNGASVDAPANGAGPIPGGSPTGNATLVPLRGGCRGGAGGRGGGLGGGGGGAIQLVAATELLVRGVISVAGGGAAASSVSSGGGGGGGSGGAILLEGGTVSIVGGLTANGGGGGEGRVVADIGADRGDDGARDAAATAAGGDSGILQFGGNGGNGAAAATAALAGRTGTRGLFDAAGGGGGGGGVGRIHVNGAASIARSAVVSPAAI